MILVHKLKGEELWVNPELIAFVERSHDTVLRLVDGRHVVVADTPEEIRDRVCHHRAAVLALAFRIHDEGADQARLQLVPDEEV